MADIKLHPCHEGVAQRFVLDGKILKSKANEGVAIDAYGTAAGSNVGLYTKHGNTNQQWYWAD